MSMHIVIRSTEDQKKELLQKGFSDKITVQWIEPNEKFADILAAAYFDLSFNDTVFSDTEFIDDKPVFVHAVNCVCKEINKPNYIRLNAWNGFLNREVTELACSNDAIKKIAEDIFNKLNWRFAWTADDYGFIAARIIAMIINEAYYALEENVSTKEQIDIAMKLGTNYPYGPFEWSEKIGLKNILHLLQKLAAQNKRYSISSLLVQESQQL
ncbi:MAG: 3-hydroxyacyl-CoA dehydrogenase family protein [Parafilimonas sp.]